MSEYDDWDDEDGNSGDGQDANSAIKKVRAADKAKAKKIAELEELLGSTRKALRDRSVKDVLTAKGINPKIASLIPADLSSEEDIETWVSEYGDVFGVAPVSDGGQQPAQTDPNTASLKNIGNVQATGQAFTGDVDQIRSLIESANTPAELDAVMAQYRSQ